MTAQPEFAPTSAATGELLMTIFLRHDQSKNLDEIQGTLAARDYWERFPPDGVTIDSWYVVMGIGQIVTLRFPAERLQAINVELERSAWGVFRTECFPAYDFVPVRERIRARSHASTGTRSPSSRTKRVKREG